MNTDPRWQDSASYGPRLAARVSTFCEWEQGDIVRMGFLPPGLVRHAAYRFPFVTDADGFRNSEPESATVVAALGDSFTDGMTLPAELTWPSRLARLLGVSVRNYGTAGFGPGQELLVLKEYVVARRARRVVVGFFAGNDLVDAERFESFQHDGGAFSSLGRGWKFKPVIARFDQLYLTSLYQGASGLLGDRKRDPMDRRSSPSVEDYDGEDPTVSSATRPAFDRGLFTVPVAGRVLRFAFLPPYLNRLTLTRRQLEASRGGSSPAGPTRRCTVWFGRRAVSSSSCSSRSRPRSTFRCWRRLSPVRSCSAPFASALAANRRRGWTSSCRTGWPSTT